MIKTNFEIINLSTKEITIDVSLLKKEQLYFNATEIAKQFGKDLSNFMRSESFNQYVGLVIADKSEPLKSRNELIKTKKGGKHQGTWLHHLLALEFASWLSIEFRYNLHKYVTQKLQDEKDRKYQRELAKGMHPAHTLAIQQAHNPAKHYHYTNEMDMINKIITGYTAKDYKQLYGVECVRDHLCVFDIELLNSCQERNKIMIDDDLEYQERKDILTKFVARKREQYLLS